MRAWSAPRWVLLAPQGLGLVAFVLASYPLITCVKPGLCAVTRDVADVLSLAFPNGLIWLLMFATPNFGIAFSCVLLLDLALALAIWRLAPPRLSLRQLLVFFLAWLVLWAVMLWLFPYFAGWGWALGHRG